MQGSSDFITTQLFCCALVSSFSAFIQMSMYVYELASCLWRLTGSWTIFVQLCWKQARDAFKEISYAGEKLHSKVDWSHTRASTNRRCSVGCMQYPHSITTSAFPCAGLICTIMNFARLFYMLRSFRWIVVHRVMLNVFCCGGICFGGE